MLKRSLRSAARVNLRFANLPALLYGWFPWQLPYESLRLFSVAQLQFGRERWAWSPQTAWDCRRALVVQRVLLAPSGYNLCARWKPVGEKNEILLSEIEKFYAKSRLTFRLDLWFPFTSFFSSNSLDWWLSSVSHDEYWLLVSIASADGDGIVSYFIASASRLSSHFSQFSLRFFLVSFFSLENSQPKHRSTFVKGKNLWSSWLAVAVENFNDLWERKKRNSLSYQCLRIFHAIKIRRRNESGEKKKLSKRKIIKFITNYFQNCFQFSRKEENWFAQLLLFSGFRAEQNSLCWIWGGVGGAFVMGAWEKVVEQFLGRKKKIGKIVEDWNG